MVSSCIDANKSDMERDVMVDETYLVSEMMKFIKVHGIKRLMELVLKALNAVG